MTYKPHYDRADWRALPTRTLIEAARDCPHELAIALGERLDELNGFDVTKEELQQENDDLTAENADLRARIEALEQTVAEHEAALGYDQ